MLRSTLLIAICALASAVAFGQDEAQYKSYMEAVQPAFGALRMAVMGKDVAAAAEAGGKLAVTFNDVLAYWQKKDVADAIAFATTARDEARAIADTKDPDVQATDMMKLQQTCGGCHMAHRGGGRGNFTIK